MNRQRQSSLVLLSVLTAASALASGVVAQQGRVLEGRSIASDALGREWAYSIYLPDGYYGSERAYPVVYLLHGIDGGHTDWVRNDDAAMTADELIERREIPPVILVMPDGGDSFWVDSDPVTGFGKVETALVEELIPHVDATWRTIPDRRHRMIAGLSMGGYGALRLAFKRPELFGAVAGLSPSLRQSATGEEFQSKAFGVPFDSARYEAETPFTWLRAFAAREPRPKLEVFLTIGDDDGFTSFLDGTMALHLALRAAKIPSELRIIDGGHSHAVWANGLREVLPWFADVMRGRR